MVKIYPFKYIKRNYKIQNKISARDKVIIFV